MQSLSATRKKLHGVRINQSINLFIFRQKCGGVVKSSQMLLTRANEQEKVTKSKGLKRAQAKVKQAKRWSVQTTDE